MKKLLILCACFLVIKPIFCQNLEKINDDELNIEKEFYTSEISDSLFFKMLGKSYKKDCTLPRKELVHVHILHKNFSGETQRGELVANRKIADKLLNIFKELYLASYQIEKVHLIDEYGADDEKSMQDNNSSCFNFRFISFTKIISSHGKGLAIDINPLYNPYVKKLNGLVNVEPKTAQEYTDRSKDFPHKITRKDLAYKIFTKYGFVWGGDWQGVKDYQHFEFEENLK
ncbi:M15 family metallopeptidase [Treponema pectinovorum]|uniref:M15 family metallopeptidase n=1 Tax=Treponema pectinovorum TaxID=164 RepID=UPI0011CA6D18|nr:M15 family metallopeptidase [Treponema pectinovorum]